MKRQSILSILLAVMLIVSNIFVTDISNTINPNSNYEIVYAASKKSSAAGGYKSGSFSHSKKSSSKSGGYKSGSFSNSKGSTSNSSSSKKDYKYNVPNTKNYPRERIQRYPSSGNGSVNNYNNYYNYDDYDDNSNGNVDALQDLPVEGYKIPDKIAYETSAEHGINTPVEDTLKKDAAAVKEYQNEAVSVIIGLVAITAMIILVVSLIKYFICKKS